MLTIQTAAETLDKCEYGQEGTREFFTEMATANLVAVFGASDDLVKFRGHFDDEAGVYNGGTVHLDAEGIMESECHEGQDCPYFRKSVENSAAIDAVWSDDLSHPAWSYTTDIPHVTFDVFKDGEIYCRGIVFDAGNLTQTPSF